MPKHDLHERSLLAAQQLILEFGVASPTMDDLAKAAHTTKMGICRSFGSREELLYQALRQMDQRAQAHWQEIVLAYPQNPKEALFTLMDEVAQNLIDGKPGCPIALISTQERTPEHRFNHLAHEHLEALQTVLYALCERLYPTKKDAAKQKALSLMLVIKGIHASCTHPWPKEALNIRQLTQDILN